MMGRGSGAGTQSSMKPDLWDLHSCLLEIAVVSGCLHGGLMLMWLIGS